MNKNAINIQADDGFTLVETLVGVFILSVVSIMSLAIMSSFADSNQMMTDKTAHLQDIEKARSFLREDLLNVHEHKIAFNGRNQMTGNTVIELTRGNGEFSKIDVNLSPAESIEYLIEDTKLIRRSYERPNITPDTPYRDYILLDNVQEIALRYYDGTLWQNQWLGYSDVANRSYPRAIEITWSLKEAENLQPFSYVNRFQLGAGQ